MFPPNCEAKSYKARKKHFELKLLMVKPLGIVLVTSSDFGQGPKKLAASDHCPKETPFHTSLIYLY